ncbi:cadherin-like protein 26 isoform X1 [Silurus meridionalis]|nr:cadherin-like protein 26 isoform X1 [Silurus meridionalis]
MRTINPVMITLFLTCIVIISTQSKIRKKRAWIIDSLTIEEENPGPFPYILDTINVERKYLVRFFLTGPGIDKDPQDVLSINARTGQVFVHKKVDYETHKNLSFKFEARDQNHKLDTNLGVEVKILDINDHAPVFTQNHYETTLTESVPQDSLVIRVSASDKDEPTSPNGTFNFLIDSVTPKTDNVEFYIKQNNTIGNIYFKGCLDYEKAQKYTLLIKAMDNGDKIQLSSTCTVVLNIIDKNNHLPEITGQTSRGQVEKSLERWRYVLERRGMKVSRSKTEYMCVNEREGSGVVRLQGEEVEKVEEFSFVKGEDKGNWVNVETDTGQIYVASVMDRESPLVNGAPYTVLVYAEEKAQSPQTGTGTLEIHLIDENDNIPLLVDDKVSMCLSDEKSMTEISAVDVDLPPYSAPFEFELLENDQVEGKWKILKINETTANLVTENTVYTGNYNIRIKILDKQGHGSVQNLSISVCNCTTNPKCGAGSFTAGPNFSAIGMMVLAFLLLLAILLMAFPQCIKQKKILILHDDVSGNIIKCNIEMPGTDCEVPFDQLHINKNGVMSEAFSKHSMHKESMSKNFTTHNIEDFKYFSKVLSKQIDQILHRLQAPEQELGDYEPHCYKYEGDPDEHPDENPDTISIPEIDFHPDILTDLDLRFSSLAAVCRPDLRSSPQKT